MLSRANLRIFASMKGHLLNSSLAKAVFTSASGRVAQLVEQCPFKAWVAGSNPAALTIDSRHESDGPGRDRLYAA